MRNVTYYIGSALVIIGIVSFGISANEHAQERIARERRFRDECIVKCGSPDVVVKFTEQKCGCVRVP